MCLFYVFLLFYSILLSCTFICLFLLWGAVCVWFAAASHRCCYRRRHRLRAIIGSDYKTDCESTHIRECRMIFFVHCTRTHTHTASKQTHDVQKQSATPFIFIKYSPFGLMVVSFSSYFSHFVDDRPKKYMWFIKDERDTAWGHGSEDVEVEDSQMRMGKNETHTKNRIAMGMKFSEM